MTEPDTQYHTKTSNPPNADETTDIATVGGDGMAAPQRDEPQIAFTESELDLLKRTICKGATDPEFDLFVSQCQRLGLDPFTNQIFAVKRWDSNEGRKVMDIQVGIDGYRLIAERTGKWAGVDGPWWCGDDGQWTDVWLQNEPPTAAKVDVHRHDWSRPRTAIARWDDYVATKKNDQPTFMWSKMGPHMLAKCAEANGLRMCFPNELSGTYTREEMDQAGGEARQVDSREHAREITEGSAEVHTQSSSNSNHGSSNHGSGRPPAQPVSEATAPDRIDREDDEDRFERTTSKNAETLRELDMGLLRTPNTKLGDKIKQVRGVVTDWSGSIRTYAEHIIACHEERLSPGSYPSEGQVRRMYAIAGDTWSKDAIDRLMKRGWGFESKEDIPSRAVYEEICYQLADDRYASVFSRDPDTRDMFENETEGAEDAAPSDGDAASESATGEPEPPPHAEEFDELDDDLPF